MKTNFQANAAHRLSAPRVFRQAETAAPAPQPAAAPQRVADLKAVASGEASGLTLESLLDQIKDLLGVDAPTGSESSDSPFTDDKAPVSSDEPFPDPDAPISSDEPFPDPDKPISSDEPFPEPTPEPTPQPNNQVIIMGNLKRPRSLRSYFEVMESRGIQVPVDWRNMPKEQLDRVVKKGHSAVMSCDGKLLGFKKTSEIKGDKDLGVGTHGDNFGNKKLPKHKRTETTNTGGNVELDGQTYEVARTFLKSPIMLDLNGDGQLSTTGSSTAKDRIDNHVGQTVQFDVDGDGVKENTEWMAGTGDGMLVDDRDGGVTAAMNGNGAIDGTRLYGDQGGKYGNGYDKLAQHDADGDGTLTGAELEGLKTWIDDGDAVVEAGELKSLAELGVSEISARMNLEKNARGEDLMRSTFVQNGQTRATEDVWFASRA